MRAHSRLGIALLLLITAACAGAAPAPKPKPEAPPAPRQVAKEKTPGERLANGHALFTSSRYAEAEAEFEKIASESSAETGLVRQGRLGLARALLITGRYGEAHTQAVTLLASTDTSVGASAALISAKANVALGKLQQAEKVLRGALSSNSSKPVALRLALGELLLELGRRADAEPVLMTIIEDYNEDRIGEQDGHGLSAVGRSAHLLRSPEDANDAFNQAEQILVNDPQTLLWRGELYLEKFDPGHAEEVIGELLEVSPNHPDGLAMMAEVKLAQALDFKEARRLVTLAQAQNPRHRKAFFVLAGLSLRDMDLSEAARWVKKGLQVNPRDLPLLSMKATERFLADEPAEFEAIKAHVLGLNSEYSRFYQIVGEYAEWEHRYDEIVTLMREAILVDNQDARAHAQLGLNAIRNGDDRGGLRSLRQAFAKDPFNVRVYNTLNLYEKVIPESYSDVKGERFNFRYPTIEKPVLERYVPPLMDAAWTRMIEYYDFTPATPVGVELYAERQNFAIRTSGLPQTAIQGVCFGKTLASMSPRHEQFNLGMTLWHELAHVFHIQLSKNHVPRWFTEGLAEYETLVQRVEWKRERDAELYDALRENRLPKIGAMNEAFTHAEDLGDVTVAYYASTQIVKMLAELYGRPKLREMLVLWGEGKRTPEVLQAALGASAEELDKKFGEYLSRSLGRFRTQFVPRQRVGNAERALENAKKHPKDPDAVSRYALLLMTTGDSEAAEKGIKQALKLDPNHEDALWLKARLALRREQPSVAEATAKKLVSLGHNGYETQLILAKAANLKKSDSAQAKALARAFDFDPTRADAPYGMLQLAKKKGDAKAEEKWLRALSKLEEHNGDLFVELSARLIAKKRLDEAVAVAESAIHAAAESVDAHLAHATALAASDKHKRAERAYVSATLCPAPAPDRARAHIRFSKYLGENGKPKRAAEELKKAQALAKPAPK